MRRVLSLVSLLVLGSAWILQGIHISPEPRFFIQDDFDLARFMGQWYEMAVVSTCPHYMKRKRENPVVVALELRHIASERNFTMTATTFRNDSCKQTSTVYGLTDVPGQFFHHIARFVADVYSHVVHTNYDEYAMMLLLSTEKPSGNKTTTVKLYSRSVDVSPAVLESFKTLVRQCGMADDAVIWNQNKSQCVSGRQMMEPSAQPQRERSRGKLKRWIFAGTQQS